MPKKSKFFLAGGAASILLFQWLLHGLDWIYPEAFTAATTFFVAFLWITECISIYAAALVPAILFPFGGIIPMKELTPLYMNDVNFLIIGGFLMAFGMEKVNLHKRIALRIILALGSSPARVMLGFMLASYVLSMWILNTATVTMLLPPALSVLGQIGTGSSAGRMDQPVLLGVAYASSIGGMATLIGTAPNMFVMDFINSQPGDLEISFTSWLAVGFPLSIILFLVCYFLLRFIYRKSFAATEMNLAACRDEYISLGKINSSEIRVLVLFVSMIVAWIFMKGVDFGGFETTGWKSLFPGTIDGKNFFIKESTVAIFFGMLLFIIPRDKDSTILEWADAKRLPIGLIFLFGAGFTIAAAFQVSGLSEKVATSLQSFGDQPQIVIVLALCLVMTFFTELASNTASITLFAPIVVELGTALNIPTLQLFIPLTLCASCAFMLPIATPPNTIVFGSDRIMVRDMMRAGFVLNMVSVVIISILGYYLVGIMN